MEEHILNAYTSISNDATALIFNRESDEFCGEIFCDDYSNLDETYFKYKIITFDRKTHVWDGGNYVTGKIIPIGEEPVNVFETDINATTYQTITDRYPVYRQVNILTDLLNTIVESGAISGVAVDEFNAMREYVSARRTLNVNYKNAYINDDSFVYISEQEATDMEARRVSGGFHEALGGRIISTTQRD